MREVGEIRLHTEGEDAGRLVPLARVELGAMKNMMRLGGLKQMKRERNLPDGTKIVVASIMGQDYISIISPAGAAAARKEEPKLPYHIVMAGNDWSGNPFYWDDVHGRIDLPIPSWADSYTVAVDISDDGKTIAGMAYRTITDSLGELAYGRPIVWRRESDGTFSYEGFILPGAEQNVNTWYSDSPYVAAISGDGRYLAIDWYVDGDENGGHTDAYIIDTHPDLTVRAAPYRITDTPCYDENGKQMQALIPVAMNYDGSKFVGYASHWAPHQGTMPAWRYSPANPHPDYPIFPKWFADGLFQPVAIDPNAPWQWVNPGPTQQVYGSWGNSPYIDEGHLYYDWVYDWDIVKWPYLRGEYYRHLMENPYGPQWDFSAIFAMQAAYGILGGQIVAQIPQGVRKFGWWDYTAQSVFQSTVVWSMTVEIETVTDADGNITSSQVNITYHSVICYTAAHTQYYVALLNDILSRGYGIYNVWTVAGPLFVEKQHTYWQQPRVATTGAIYSSGTLRKIGYGSTDRQNISFNGMSRDGHVLVGSRNYGGPWYGPQPHTRESIEASNAYPYLNRNSAVIWTEAGFVTLDDDLVQNGLGYNSVEYSASADRVSEDGLIVAGNVAHSYYSQTGYIVKYQGFRYTHADGKTVLKVHEVKDSRITGALVFDMSPDGEVIVGARGVDGQPCMWVGDGYKREAIDMSAALGAYSRPVAVTTVKSLGR